MGDSTSAGTFHDIYTYLAKNLDKQHPEVQKDRLKFARELRKWSRFLDFNDGDLECDSALIKLKLAERCETCKRAKMKEDAEEHGAGICDE